MNAATTIAEAAVLLDEVSTGPTAVRIAQTVRAIAPVKHSLARATMRLGCISSFTFEPLLPSLELAALRSGLVIEPFVAPFGQIDQSLLDPGSALIRFKPDFVLVAVRLADVCPAIYESFNGLSAADSRALLESWMTRLRAGLESLRARWTGPILIQNYEQPCELAMGIADPSAEHSQASLIAGANQSLRELATRIGNVHVMDYDRLVARVGRDRWSDPRTALFARIPVAPANYWPLASSYVRYLRPIAGLSKKVLVLDADNTLWGGVVGDAGIGGIDLGPDYPGNAFVAFQNRILELHRRGVILCLASKNEAATVEDVLRNHPAMVLREEHFAARRINWRPKPENLREMAAELNLGLDSFVFVDDSPVECDLVRRTMPEVICVCLPAEPAELPALAKSLDWFDQLSISEEDRQRGAMYRAESDRRELQAAAVDLPGFYRGLEMVMSVSINDASALSRIAQMAARTNQFNMHTLRYSEADFRRFMASGDHKVITIALKDRFGDNGIVGLAVVRLAADEWTLHMMFMSCRVLGRTVEDCFIRWIAGEARQAGAKRLLAEFVATAKNRPFAGFFSSFGFKSESRAGDVEIWSLNLSAADLTQPDWMTIAVKQSAGEA